MSYPLGSSPFPALPPPIRTIIACYLSCFVFFHHILSRWASVTPLNSALQRNSYEFHCSLFVNGAKLWTMSMSYSMLFECQAYAGRFSEARLPLANYTQFVLFVPVWSLPLVSLCAVRAVSYGNICIIIDGDTLSPVCVLSRILPLATRPPWPPSSLSGSLHLFFTLFINDVLDFQG